MNLATVIGTATATIKHRSLSGWRMVVVQPMKLDGSEHGDPLIAVDALGSSLGSRVVITSDGATVRNMMRTNTTPVRWAVIALPDDEQGESQPPADDRTS